MKKVYLKNSLFALSLGACFFMSACGGKQTDAEIQQDVQEVLKGEGNNSAYSNIEASVADGIVTLNGDCQGQNCPDSVNMMVKEINGVEEVVNNVRQISAETDLTLRSSVQAVISKYEGVQADVANGVVVLRGLIMRDQVQPLMNELGSLDAKKLDNQLAIK